MAEVKKLKCDVCGGNIRVQAGGQFGICENCGTEYTIERMREIFSGMKVSVTGSESDVEQWKMVLKKYMDNLDFQAALPIARKIMEAVPDDKTANAAYKQLMLLQHFEIRNGCLQKYEASENVVYVPAGITKIGKGAFCGTSAKVVYLPNSVTEIEEEAFDMTLEKIILGEGLKVIRAGAFMHCYHLNEIIIPKSIEKIEGCPFPRNLKRLSIPDNCEICLIEGRPFSRNLKRLSIPNNCELEFYGFLHDMNQLETVNAAPDFEDHFIMALQEWKKSNYSMPYGYSPSPWLREVFKRFGKCQFCGSDFKGVLKKVCPYCQRQKDY